jgi:hypothetical protein
MCYENAVKIIFCDIFNLNGSYLSIELIMAWIVEEYGSVACKD